MKKTVVIAAVLAAVFVSLAALVLFLVRRPVPYRFVAASRSEIKNTLSLRAVLRGGDPVFVSGEESGRLDAFMIQKGDPVRKGDVLFTFLLSDGTYRAVRSPSDGYVSAILCAEGTYLAAGIPAVILTDTEHMTLAAEADEVYLSRLANGQKVSVVFDAFPEKIVEAEIEEVFPFASVSGGAAALLWKTGSTTVEVRIRMLEDVDELIPGLSATATVETCRVKDALLIPSVSLLSDEKGDYVYVFSKGCAVKKYVKKGSVAGEMTQIVDGLECGEEVIASPDDALSPGMRVRHVE